MTKEDNGYLKLDIGYWNKLVHINYYLGEVLSSCCLLLCLSTPGQVPHPPSLAHPGLVDHGQVHLTGDCVINPISMQYLLLLYLPVTSAHVPC